MLESKKPEERAGTGTSGGGARVSGAVLSEVVSVQVPLSHIGGRSSQQTFVTCFSVRC